MNLDFLMASYHKLEYADIMPQNIQIATPIQKQWCQNQKQVLNYLIEKLKSNDRYVIWLTSVAGLFGLYM